MIEPLDAFALGRTLAAFVLPIALLAWTAWVAGRTALTVLGIGMGGDDALESVALAVTTGLALLAHALLGLGLAGALRPAPVVALAAAVHAVALAAPVSLRPPRPSRRLVVIGALAALPFVLPALYPDTGFDSRMYHLPYVRAFARSGGVPFLADLRFPIFPQAAELLSTALVLSGNDASASGAGLLAVALGAALVAAWARRAFPAWPCAGVLAAAILLGSPLLGYLASVLYVDPLLGLFTTAALFAAERFRATRERGWVVLAALLAASAADVKYLGLYTVAVAALAVAFGGPRALALFAAVALACVAPWYGRIVAATGNPVFPYLPSVFGAGPWTPHPEPTLALGTRLWNALRMPVDLVIARSRWNQMPPLSPVFALALPLVAFAAPRSRTVAGWAAVVGAFVGIYQWLPKSAAYTAMVLPLASLAVVGALAVTFPGRLAAAPRVTLVAAALCVAPGWLYGFYTAARHGPLPVTDDARERYLARTLPLHAAISALDRRHGSAYTVWGVDSEHMTDFARGRLLGDTSGRRELAERAARVDTPDELRTLLTGLGVGHVLVPAGAPSPFPRVGPLHAIPWLEPWYQDPNATVYALRPDVP